VKGIKKMSSNYPRVDSRILVSARRGARFGSVLLAFLLLSASTGNAENRVRIRDAEGVRGANGVEMLITATNDVPVDAYSLAVTFPANVVSLVRFDSCGSSVEPLEPAFEAPLIDNALGWGTLAVVIRVTELGDNVRMEPQEALEHPRVIARLHFDVHPHAREGVYPIRLVNGVGTRSITNEFSNRGRAVVPVLVDGRLHINGENILLLERKLAFCDASPQVTIRALARHPDPLVAFSIATSYDCTKAVFDPTRARIGQGVISSAAIGSVDRIEFLLTDDDGCRVRTAVIPDSLPPFDEPPRTIDAHTEDVTQILMEYVFEPIWDSVDCAANESIDLRLEQLDTPRALNSAFVVGEGDSIEPRLHDGKIYLQNGGLTGRVLDARTGLGLPGVTVELEPGFVRTETIRPSGSFTFPVLPPGEYFVRFSMSEEAREDPQIGDFHKEIVSEFDVIPGAATVNVLPDVAMYPRSPECARVGVFFSRGDVSGDGRVDIADAVQIFQYLFLGNDSTVPLCFDAADKNGNRILDLSDGIGLLGFLFRGEDPPASPFPECGISSNGLGCEEHAACAAAD